MSENKSSACETFVSAPALEEVLGCSRSAIYRLIESLQLTVTMTAENGAPIEVKTVPELGGVKWPESDWSFERAAAQRYRNRILRKARRMERPAEA